MTDADLLRRVKRGDAAAWRELYTRCLPVIWRYVYARTGDHSLAEDVVSETMLALVSGLPRLDPDNCQLHGWLRRVAQNKLSDHGRWTARQIRLLEGAAHDPRVGVPDDDPARPMEVDETCTRVLEVLDQMPAAQRLVLEWKYGEQLSVREIADRNGQTEKAAESILYRARLEFRRLYNAAECPGVAAENTDTREA